MIAFTNLRYVPKIAFNLNSVLCELVRIIAPCLTKDIEMLYHGANIIVVQIQTHENPVKMQNITFDKIVLKLNLKNF